MDDYEYQRGGVSFIAKEGANELFIAIEPMTGPIPILKRGMFCLAMCGRPEWEKVQEVAKFLRENCEELVFLPGSARIIHSDFDKE